MIVLSKFILESALVAAEVAWGAPANILTISSADLGPCDTPSSRGAYSEFGPRTVTINANCRWTPDLLQIAVNHEYGHMLVSTAEHSTDKRSVMYWKLGRGQRVTATDKRERAAMLKASL